MSFISTAGSASLINTADEAYDLDNDILFGNNAFELREFVIELDFFIIFVLYLKNAL